MNTTERQADFYILANTDISPEGYGVRLAEKIYRRSLTLVVVLPDEPAVNRFNEALWSASPEQFIAHDKAPVTGSTPLLVGTDASLRDARADVLLNLAGDVPTAFERFGRIAEIVPASLEARTQSRTNYRRYQESGYAMKTHQIGAQVR